EDHIHLLVSIPPTMRVGKVVGLLKSNTAVGLKQKIPFLKMFIGAQIQFGQRDIL
ncbi:transposase, partial [Candidatus Dojkabacteria bacterium]|nr:transposase [Candidatus Dojkabacteria bacterium]